MLGNRIKQARKVRGMTRTKLSEESGVPYSTLADIESGRQKGSTQAHVIATALRVRVDWLVDGKLPMDAPVATDEDDFPPVKAYRQPAALGDGAEPDEYAETHRLKFRAESLRRKRLNPDKLAVCYGKGDSMLPRIKTGDAILFDRSDKDPKDGAIFVVTYERQLLAKRLVLLGGRWFIESENKDDPKWKKPEPIDEHKGFEIHGRVRWIGSWED